ncbi:hypothetical protein IW140_004381 [Coemansia sp. RSA 1813]|nr:hypothetical protein LPJ74_004889 [Coemansia sp. RSA 1843]KAJ2087896.1 hypothetical protein IW138_004594 [Coemansia sp. RSA 986]KAJ2212908.1 hypothetical protein EV179_004309 [Coemansia sp. RSA 487]KAJ2567678.1 hypothetical protein IW140_004381 [Coemansia sp. RSA 1813]
MSARRSTDKTTHREALQKRRPSSSSEGEEPDKMERASSSDRQASKRRNVLQFWRRRRSSNSHESSCNATNEVQAVVPESGYSESSTGSDAEGTSSPQAADRPADLPTAVASEMAAVRIQRAWRIHVLRSAIEAWQKSGVTVERLRGLSFDDATELMQRPAVVRGSVQLLETLLAQVARDSVPGKPEQAAEIEATPCPAPGRTFVAAHLFAAHPELLATGDTAQDAMVEAAASTMTQAYEQFAARFLESHASTAAEAQAPGGYCYWLARLHSFASSFHAFAVALDSWKRADSKKLLAAMERHYLELDRLWQSVQRRTLGQGDEAWRVSIHEQRAALVDRVRTLGGQRAVDQLVRRQRHLRLTYADVQPSRTPSLPPPPPPPQCQPEEQDAEAVVGGVDSMRVDSHQDSASATDAVVARAVADPSAAQVDRILGNFDLTASAALENASLAHELVLDPEMRLQPIDQTTPVGSVQHTVARAFFDHIGREMAGDTRKAREHVADLFAYLQRELRTIIPPAGDARKAVDRELDPDWIGTLLGAGAHREIVHRLTTAVRLIREVCAPVRDPEIDAVVDKLESLDTSALITELASSTTDSAAASFAHSVSENAKECVSSLLGAARDTIDLIHRARADALNHQLDTVVRPWLRAHAAEYERSKLDQYLENLYGGRGDQVLEATTGWMRTAVDRDLADRCIVLQNTTRAITAKHIFWESLLDLCFEPTAANTSCVPLTLAMDADRISAIQNDIQVVLSTGALCILARSIARTNTGASLADAHITKLATDIHGLLTDRNVTMQRVIALVNNAVNSAPATATSQSSDTHDPMANGDAALHKSIDRLVRKTLAKDDPVYVALERQLRMFLLQELCSDETPTQLGRRIDVHKQTIDAHLRKFGLDVVARNVCDLLMRLSRLGSFNWQVCSIWYAKVTGLAPAPTDE